MRAAAWPCQVGQGNLEIQKGGYPMVDAPSTETEHYDVVIVGSGAGGGTLAYALANAGKKILILERGQFLPQEPQNWDPHAVFVEHRYRTKEKWLDKQDKPFIPNTNYWVGGNTSFYGANPIVGVGDE